MLRALLSSTQLGQRCLLPHRRQLAAARAAMPGKADAGQPLPGVAAERSGVPLEKAFAIDEDANLYERLGHQTLVKLSTEFYNRVYEDEEQLDCGGGRTMSFKQIFSKFKKEDSIRNQYEFVIQRLHGPPLYSQRKGHPALMARHSHFPCTEATAERFMAHMGAALEAVHEIDADARQRLHDYFRHTCFFLVTGQEAMQSRRSDWPRQQQEEEQHARRRRRRDRGVCAVSSSCR